MTDWEEEFITTHRVAHLATVDAQGRPHVVPIVYAYAGTHLFTPIDAKPKRVESHRLRRVRNIQANPHVAVILDDYAEDWTQLAWVQVRGTAMICTEGAIYQTGIALLTKKYPQYAEMPLHGRPLIAISPVQVVSWRAA